MYIAGGVLLTATVYMSRGEASSKSHQGKSEVCPSSAKNAFKSRSTSFSKVRHSDNVPRLRVLKYSFCKVLIFNTLFNNSLAVIVLLFYNVFSINQITKGLSVFVLCALPLQHIAPQIPYQHTFGRTFQHAKKSSHKIAPAL